jgi:3-oxoacyl-[acyl-carrier protein] reductase
VLRPGVAGLVKSLSQELGSDNIRVNAILPGWTRTDRTVEIFAKRAHVNNTDVATEMAQITQAIPLGRMAEPVEFAQVATFLCSPASSYISGVMLTVDGGLCQGLI